MRQLARLALTVGLMAASQFDATAQDNKGKSQAKPAAQPAAKASAAPAAPAKPTAAPAKEPAPPTPAAEEQLIRQSGDAYVKAFNQKDAKAVAELYTADAEYVDIQGALVQSRAAIEESLKAFFAANPECQIQLNVLSVRMPAANVAIEDGLTTIQVSKTVDPVTTRYTAIHAKNSGKWAIASVRDAALPQPGEHRNRLKQFEWMLGQWVHEGPDATIVFNCKAIDGGNYLSRDFTIRIAGKDAISGSQRIGWDAQAGKFKSWVFDSDGGHSEGYWHRDGDSWVLKAYGVTADGQSASSTSIYGFENPHTMTFQSMDHEVAGIEYPDSPQVKIVRQPPKPE